MVNILFKQNVMSSRRVNRACKRCGNDVPVGNHYFLDRSKIVCENCLSDNDFVNLKDTFKRIDETFNYRGVSWNVGAIIDDINNGASFRKVSVETKLIRNANFDIVLDPDRVDEVDFNVDGILIDLGNRGRFVLDGHHRIEKAFRCGVEVLSFNLLSFDEQVRYLVFLDRKALVRFVSELL